MTKAPLCVASRSRLRLVHWGEDELLFRDRDSDRLFGIAGGAVVPHPPLPCVDSEAIVGVEDGRDPRRLVIGRTTNRAESTEVWSQVREGDRVETAWHGDVHRLIPPLAPAVGWLALRAGGAVIRIADGTKTAARLDVEMLRSRSLAALPEAVLSFSTLEPLRLHPLNGDVTRRWKDKEVPDAEMGEGRVLLRGDALVVACVDSGRTSLFELSATTLAPRAALELDARIHDIVALGTDSVFARTDGGLLIVERPFGDDTTIDRVSREMEFARLASHGDHFIATELDTAYVGRLGTAPATFMRMNEAAGVFETMYACEHGVVFESEHATIVLPWQTFEQEGELVVDRIEVALASRGYRGKVLLAGATILRVEICEPPPKWSRTTMTIPSHGNPLGLRVGEEVIAEGPEVAGELSVTSLRRPDDSGASDDRLIGGGVERFGRIGGVQLPDWAADLVSAGLIDEPSMLPMHVWELTPLRALSQIYEPRGAMQRGFLRYDWKFWRDTEDPAADLVALARASGVEARCIDPQPDDEEVRVRSSVRGEPARTTMVPLGGGSFSALVTHVNGLLARAECPRRIYECDSGADWYAFFAATPDEWEKLIAARIVPRPQRAG